MYPCDPPRDASPPAAGDWLRVAQSLIGRPSGLESDADFAEAAARGEVSWELDYTKATAPRAEAPADSSCLPIESVRAATLHAHAAFAAHEPTYRSYLSQLPLAGLSVFLWACWAAARVSLTL